MSVASSSRWPALAAILGVGCGLLDPSDPKPAVPRDHSENLGGAWHRTGAHEPYLPPTSCYTFQCHHVNLRGGWSLASGFDGGEPMPTYARPAISVMNGTGRFDGRRSSACCIR